MKIKIAFLIASLGAGGKERQLFYLLENLASTHYIELFIFDEDVFYDEVFSLPIKIHIYNKSEKYSFKTIKSLYCNLLKFRPQVVHSWSDIFTFITLPLLVFQPKIKLVSSIRYAGKIKKTIIARVVQKLSFLRSRAIVSNSKEGLIVEKLNNNEKATVIYNGFDINKFELNSEFKTEISNLLPNNFTNKVVMIGRFYKAKDYKTFINAVKIVAQSNKEVCFICVGDGPMKNNAEKEANALINKRVFFIENCKNISYLLSKMDVGVLLNNTDGHAEGISNVIMEYMASGLPVIATNAGGTPELVQDNISGFLVPAFDENIVADKILFLLKNKYFREKMGESGKEILLKDFTMDKMVNAYFKLYQRIVYGTK